jgi:aspartate/methionine/tyrosine aminotransferase
MFDKQGRTSGIQEAPIQKLLMECDVPPDAVSLGQGVPFFPPPTEAVEAAKEALDQDKGFRYSEDAGFLSLREAVARKLESRNGISADPASSIMITAGANQGFLNAALAITEPGDEMILLSPYYFNHVMALQLANCNPVMSQTSSDYQPDLDDIFSKVTDRTRAIVTISPNNPTGAVYSPQALKDINIYCRDNGIYHISDEAYEDFVFDGAEHISPGAFDMELNHTISLFSFSKSFGMPGYRIGYMVYPSRLNAEILKVQDTLVICPPGPAQVAAEAALVKIPDYPSRFVAPMNEVRELFKKQLADLSKVQMPLTKGGYYFLLQLETDLSSWEISKQLIEDFKVITIPGSAFGDEHPSIRLSYGNIDRETAVEGLQRLKDGLASVL